MTFLARRGALSAMPRWMQLMRMRMQMWMRPPLPQTLPLPLPQPQPQPLRLLVAAAAVALAACAPALDWRDVRPAGSGVLLQFPCRPYTQERQVALAGAPVRLALLVCTADGQTWALATADMADPARVGPALDALRQSAAANVAAAGGTPLAFNAPGATPNAQAGRVQLAGSLPPESPGAARAPVQMQLAVFAHGTQVYQATVLGERVGSEAADIFFGSIRAGALAQHR